MQDTLLKTDSPRRAVTPPDQREALLDAFERGSASAKAFAAEHRVKCPTFALWVRRRRQQRGSSPQGCIAPFSTDSGSAGAWVEAVAGGASAFQQQQQQHPAASGCDRRKM